MGHYSRRSGSARSGRGFILGALARMPRGLKIGLVLAALLVALVAVALVGLAVVVLVKVVAGGTLPGLQDALDFAKRNLQPLLDFWKALQSLTGK